MSRFHDGTIGDEHANGSRRSARGISRRGSAVEWVRVRDDDPPRRAGLARLFTTTKFDVRLGFAPDSRMRPLWAAVYVEGPQPDGSRAAVLTGRPQRLGTAPVRFDRPVLSASVIASTGLAQIRSSRNTTDAKIGVGTNRWLVLAQEPHVLPPRLAMPQLAVLYAANLVFPLGVNEFSGTLGRPLAFALVFLAVAAPVASSPCGGREAVTIPVAPPVSPGGDLRSSFGRFALWREESLRASDASSDSAVRARVTQGEFRLCLFAEPAAPVLRHAGRSYISATAIDRRPSRHSESDRVGAPARAGGESGAGPPEYMLAYARSGAVAACYRDGARTDACPAHIAAPAIISLAFEGDAPTTFVKRTTVILFESQPAQRFDVRTQKVEYRGADGDFAPQADAPVMEFDGDARSGWLRPRPRCWMGRALRDFGPAAPGAAVRAPGRSAGATARFAGDTFERRQTRARLVGGEGASDVQRAFAAEANRSLVFRVNRDVFLEATLLMDAHRSHGVRILSREYSGGRLCTAHLGSMNLDDVERLAALLGAVWLPEVQHADAIPWTNAAGPASYMVTPAPVGVAAWLGPRVGGSNKRDPAGEATLQLGEDWIDRPQRVAPRLELALVRVSNERCRGRCVWQGQMRTWWRAIWDGHASPMGADIHLGTAEARFGRGEFVAVPDIGREPRDVAYVLQATGQALNGSFGVRATRVTPPPRS